MHRFYAFLLPLIHFQPRGLAAQEQKITTRSVPAFPSLWIPAIRAQICSYGLSSFERRDFEFDADMRDVHTSGCLGAVLAESFISLNES